ncbi:hypothetical protein [Halochromatium glycolicum]|uniref:VPLPA-CTERM protein sorting domain-containing protein n=1 Tax=Halochromatium glycolicum TaxID=85075 RepID=A0AAJ0U6U0_9GAMM|nr:hypothetical protein [Halochromatium glycolicum]MBK1706359.1 hypothetical protein [Halochromatium glycolicum]
MSKMKVLAGAAFALSLAFGVVHNATASTIVGQDFGPLGVGDSEIFYNVQATQARAYSDAWTFTAAENAIVDVVLVDISVLDGAGGGLGLLSGIISGGTVDGTLWEGTIGSIGSSITTFDPTVLLDAGTGAATPFELLSAVVNAGEEIGIVVSGDGPAGYAGIVSLTQVPIPAAVWLFGSSLLGVVWVGRRRRSAQTA